ncbi:Protein of unknown function DUF359 [Ignisphaera aggregans DSM 17230]|uniref:GTP-dependent dephospho-CoA kinase n=1 Tax=Ignisphaera aggregans (strain DSM 17230 / JCM 13409 / AQ1.S1) TaxID=583356 RepID=E0ST29_IGNAA|nr:Protein of unknown function DUF359 [Ignisphaera aggregans DSM 17230]
MLNDLGITKNGTAECFLMPNELRNLLTYFHIYKCSYVLTLRGDRESIGILLRLYYSNYVHETMVVGDYCCKTYIEFVGVPRLCIVDGKTLRYNNTDIRDIERRFNYVERCVNPRGCITTNCMEAIKRCYKEGVPCLLIVDGEEDLLTLATIILIDHGIVVYGVPHEGIAIIPIDKAKVDAINIFSQFIRLNSLGYKDLNYV